MITRNTFIAVAAVAAAAAGFWMADMLTGRNDPGAGNTAAIQGFVLKSPRKLGVPDLLQDDGSRFEQSDLAGRWSLVFFGYTHCPDICPTTLNTVAEAKKQSGDFPQVVFISVDPQRDDVELVGEYVRYFDEDFVGVTGDEKLLQAMASQMSVLAKVMPSDRPGEYLVDHSANLLLIDPEVRLAAMLKPPHTINSIREGLEAVVQSEL